MAHVIDSRGVDLGDITNPDLLTYYRREPGYTVGGVTTPANPARSSADILPVWAANTIYAAGQEILDPTGVTILVRQSTGTSRSTYDATEQALWSAAGAGTTGSASTLTPTAVKTANYTAAAGDFVPVDTTSGNVTVTLPTAPADKTQIGVKHVIRGGTNTVTIACGGSDVFNKTGGSSTGTLTLTDQGKIFQYKASSAIWYAVSDDLALSQVVALLATVAFNVQSGTSYTFVLTDATVPTLVDFTNPSAVTATIPPESSVAWPAGSVILFGQGGAGQVTIAAGAGVTIRTPNGAKTAQQFSQGSLTKRATNDWIVSGDTST